MAITWRDERPDATTAASQSDERPSRLQATIASALTAFLAGFLAIFLATWAGFLPLALLAGAFLRVRGVSPVEGKNLSWVARRPKSGVVAQSCGAFMIARAIQDDDRGRARQVARGTEPPDQGGVQRGQDAARPLHHRDGDLARQILPPPPAAELCQIVASHQPDELDFGKAPLQRRDRVDGVTGAKTLFQAAHMNAGMVCRHRPRGFQARREWRHAGFVLQRISGTDQPPDGIELPA